VNRKMLLAYVKKISQILLIDIKFIFYLQLNGESLSVLKLKSWTFSFLFQLKRKMLMIIAFHN